MGGWMHGWLDGWMHGWLDVCVNGVLSLWRGLALSPASSVCL